MEELVPVLADGITYYIPAVYSSAMAVSESPTSKSVNGFGGGCGDESGSGAGAGLGLRDGSGNGGGHVDGVDGSCRQDHGSSHGLVYGHDGDGCGDGFGFMDGWVSYPPPVVLAAMHHVVPPPDTVLAYWWSDSAGKPINSDALVVQSCDYHLRLVALRSLLHITTGYSPI